MDMLRRPWFGMRQIKKTSPDFIDCIDMYVEHLHNLSTPIAPSVLSYVIDSRWSGASRSDAMSQGSHLGTGSALVMISFQDGVIFDARTVGLGPHRDAHLLSRPARQGQIRRLPLRGGLHRKAARQMEARDASRIERVITSWRCRRPRLSPPAALSRTPRR